MPLEANLFYGGTTSPSSSRGSSSKTKRPLAGLRESTMASTSQLGGSIASTSRNVHTPSPNRTSRIPPPPSSPSPSARRATASSRRRPAATSSKVSPSKFKLHFQGRVYRPFAATSPSSARKLYSPSQGLLGQPDELVEHADATIDCPCKRNEDDNTLMIQCEECDIWLHARCVGYEYEEQCPERYYCKKCAPLCSNGSSGKLSEQLQDTGRLTPEPQSQYKGQRNRMPSPPSSTASPLSDSEEDGGLEVEIPAPLDASPLNRTPTRTPTKRTADSPSQYSVSRNLLSELANASPINKASPSHPLLTPSKRTKADSSSSAVILEDESSVTPQKRSRISQQSDQPLDASTVPLPDHYTALLNLHAAVERALLLHLATEGARACSAAVVSTDTTHSSNGTENLLVDLPNLATFTGIRSVVERGSGRRFGPTELAQLTWLWEGGLHGPQAMEDPFTTGSSSLSLPDRNKDKRRGGLSMSVSSAREIDRNNGKRVYTWGIGIHLELKQNIQLPALEVVGSSPSRSNQTVESPPALNMKRVGMSVLPLWSSKAEYRRDEMRRRLGECVLKAHDDFACSRSTNDSQSASKKKHLSDPFERELQLPPTPPPSNRKRNAATSSSMFVKGFILDALPPIPAATLPSLGPSSSTSLSNPLVNKVNGIANADTVEIAQADRAAIMPNTRESMGRRKSSTQEQMSVLLEGNKERVQKAPVEQRAMSLLDRIKAKEAAQQAAKAAQSSSLPSSTCPSGKISAKATHQNAVISSLEAASARAKKKASQRVL